jgi:L-ascorbate metabolism protein UlaG (beta-lactamase superfamily)
MGACRLPSALSAAGNWVRFLGHATVEVELQGTRLLTDPVLRNRLGPLVRQPRIDGPAPHPDAVLISHLHGDHFDLPSLRRLGNEVRLIVPAGAARYARRKGFTAVSELAPGESEEVGPLSVTAVGAVHSGRRWPFGSGAESVGYVVAGARRVYFAGDTDLFDGMAELAPGLDVALLPVWGWGPTIGKGHLDPRRAAEALRLLRPRLAVPIHWGTLYPFGLRRIAPRRLTEPPREFARFAAQLAPEVEVQVLAPGEQLLLGSQDGDGGR